MLSRPGLLSCLVSPNKELTSLKPCDLLVSCSWHPLLTISSSKLITGKRYSSCCRHLGYAPAPSSGLQPHQEQTDCLAFGLRSLKCRPMRAEPWRDSARELCLSRSWSIATEEAVPYQPQPALSQPSPGMPSYLYQVQRRPWLSASSSLMSLLTLYNSTGRSMGRNLESVDSACYFSELLLQPNKSVLSSC